MADRDYHNDADSDLTSLFTVDAKKAFEAIYSRYWHALYVYVLKIVANRDDAKDILQEIFVSLWNRRSDLKEISSLKSYLFAAARYKSLDYIKQNIHRNNYLDSLLSFFEEEDLSCDAQHSANELSLLIDSEVNRMPVKMREVFILSRRDDLSHKLISEKLMISEKTVKKQINNVLKVLRLKFTEK